MMSNERNIDLSVLDSLSPEERALALEALRQYAANGSSEILDVLKFGDFEEIPVDINTFLDDPTYLGNSIWMTDEYTGERKCTLFPYWRETLERIFPDNISTSVNTLILTGSIGLGKTQEAVNIMLYLLYRMLCLKDPYAYYGLMPNDKITFSMLNVTMEAASGVGWDKLQQMVQASPWFMAHGALNASRTNPQWQPDKHIELVFGSSNRQVVGRALFCLDGATQILAEDGIATLAELVNKQIRVISVDDFGNKVLSDTCTVRPTVCTDEEYQIELEDDTIIKCTSNHMLRLVDGSYKEAKDLTENDELMEIQSSHKLMKIKSIKKVILDGPNQYYDVIEAAPYHNFLIKTNESYIISHNCNFSDK